jgi:hypothetical protein
MHPTKFRFIAQSAFRTEHFWISTNQKQEFSVAVMFVNGSGRNEQSLKSIIPGCFLPNSSSFGKAVSEEKIIKKSTNQKKELPVTTMFVNGSGRNGLSL